MTTRLLIAYAFLLTVSFTACEKEPPIPPGPTPDITPQAVYDYGFFKPGTYWIYEDSLTGSRDSVYVIYVKQGKDTLDVLQGDGPKIYDRFEVKMYSTFEGYDYYLWYSGTWSGKPRRDKLFLTKSKPGDYVGEIILCEIPAVIGNILYNWQSDNNTTTTAFYPQMVINTSTYSSVIKANQSIDVLQSGQAANYFIARNTGIVKREYLDSNRVWKLVSTQVYQ